MPAGESLNLSCSVQAGTEPVTFTWLRDGQELGSGPVLSLGTVGPADAGTYQCLATNRLSTRRTFEAHSPALNLSVTQLGWGRQQRGTGGGHAHPPPPRGPHRGLGPWGRCSPGSVPALSPAVAAGLSVSLLLLLLLSAAVAWHLWRRRAGGWPTPGGWGLGRWSQWAESSHAGQGGQWGCTPHPLSCCS